TPRVDRAPKKPRREGAAGDLLVRRDRCEDFELLVADELGRWAAEVSDDADLGRGRDLAVLGHVAGELVLVDLQPALGGELAGQLERESVGGGERERVLAGDRASCGHLLEDLQATLERLREALLLGLDRFAG